MKARIEGPVLCKRVGATLGHIVREGCIPLEALNQALDLHWGAIFPDWEHGCFRSSSPPFIVLYV